MKVMSTHLSVGSIEVLHVEGDRKTVIAQVEGGNKTAALGIDLSILTRTSSKGTFQRQNIWVGMMALAQAIIGGEHEVEVSDEPFGSADHAIPMPTPDEGLTVEL